MSHVHLLCLALLLLLLLRLLPLLLLLLLLRLLRVSVACTLYAWSSKWRSNLCPDWSPCPASPCLTGPPCGVTWYFDCILTSQHSWHGAQSRERRQLQLESVK